MIDGITFPTHWNPVRQCNWIRYVTLTTNKCDANLMQIAGHPMLVTFQVVRDIAPDSVVKLYCDESATANMNSMESLRSGFLPHHNYASINSLFNANVSPSAMSSGTALDTAPGVTSDMSRFPLNIMDLRVLPNQVPPLPVPHQSPVNLMKSTQFDIQSLVSKEFKVSTNDTLDYTGHYYQLSFDAFT